MKIRKHLLAFFAMLLLGTSTILGGCATTGMDRSVKTSNSIRDVDKEIRKMMVQIDVTAASLDSLVMPASMSLPCRRLLWPISSSPPRKATSPAI